MGVDRSPTCWLSRLELGPGWAWLPGSAQFDGRRGIRERRGRLYVAGRWLLVRGLGTGDGARIGGAFWALKVLRKTSLSNVSLIILDSFLKNKLLILLCYEVLKKPSLWKKTLDPGNELKHFLKLLHQLNNNSSQTQSNHRTLSISKQKLMQHRRSTSKFLLRICNHIGEDLFLRSIIQAFSQRCLSFFFNWRLYVEIAVVRYLSSVFSLSSRA